MIKGVLFDVDGVLIDSFDANLKFYQHLFFKAGYGFLTRERYAQMYHLSLTDVVKEVTKSHSKKEVQRIFDMGFKRVIPYPVDMLKLYDGVSLTIQKLYKQYKLGIVTSRLTNSVFEYSKLAKLKKYFAAVVAYEDTINHKPHPEPLLFAAKKLQIKPKEIVYVGDLNNDIQAAKAAGMNIIVFSAKHFPSADLSTSSFIEIPSLIESIHG